MKAVLIFILLFSNVWAQNTIPVDKKLDQRIADKFMIGDSFSWKKIDDYRKIVWRRKIELSEIIRKYERLHEGEEYLDVVESIEEEKILKALNIILTYLYQLDEEEDFDKQRQIAWKILELDFASKVEGYEILGDNVVSFVRSLTEPYIISKDFTPQGEAKNLFDPSRGVFFSENEVDDLVEQGFDISTLDPSPNSRFWYKKDIKNDDLKKTYLGNSPLYENVDIKFPEKNRGLYKKVKKSQTKPKVHFTSVIDGRKFKFKLKFGAELASEITAGALYSSLGFYHDVSKYVQDFELVLPEKMTYLDFKREWLEYFKKYDPEDYIKSVENEDGRVVIVFREALIEAKPEEILRIGPWAWGQHQGLREVRGMLAFNMWIANNDIKEAGNNKLVLKYNEKEQDYDIYQFIHDLGFSFGRFTHEKPGDFPWNLIQSYSEREVNFRYYNFQRSSGFKHVSYYDVKWMVRKIAQLTRYQITQAVELGGWPEDIRALYVEKLVARRNQMVKAFGLEAEYGIFDYDRNITTESGAVQNGNLTRSQFEGYSQDFGSEIQTLLKPFYENLDYLASQAVIKSLSAVDTMIISGREFGYDTKLITEIQLSVDREVRRNELVNGNDDNYIVQDKLRVRFGLGAGLVLRGKVNYYREYRILYPVKSLSETGFDNKYILKAMAPKILKDYALPENYVLLLEDGIEGEGELLLGAQSLPVSVGLSAAVGKLSRTIVSKKLEQVDVYQDASLYRGYYARLYAELLVLRIPVWQFSKQSGILGRFIYTLDLADQNTKDAKLFALEEMIKTGDMEWVEKFGTKKSLQSYYTLQRNDFDIYFFENDYRRRTDDLLVYENDSTMAEQTIYQVDIERHSEWTFFGNGEVKDRRYRLYGEVDSQGHMQKALLDMRLFIKDINATSQEFQNAYLPMFDQLSMQKRFFNFTPELHSINQIWHSLEVEIKLSYDKTALDKIIDTPDQVYFDLMASFSDYDADFWGKGKRKGKIDSNTKFIKKKFDFFIKALKKARVASTDRERYTIITDAFSNLVWKLSDGYQCLLLGRIHHIVGADGFYMEGEIKQSESVENTMPTKTPLYNVLNPAVRNKFNMLEFDYKELEEIWELFQA